jgi:anthranilate/para-aminobenzoate synthase component II
MKILVIDNYDSFTFNLVQLLGKYKNDLIIKRNDEVTMDEICNLNPAKILISPGPGRPENSKISLKAIKKFG